MYQNYSTMYMYSEYNVTGTYDFEYDYNYVPYLNGSFIRYYIHSIEVYIQKRGPDIHLCSRYCIYIWSQSKKEYYSTWYSTLPVESNCTTDQYRCTGLGYE
jgi:hypothetical protein